MSTNKKTTNTKPKPAATTNNKEKQPKPPINLLRYSLLVTAVFFIMVLIGILHHEMWRDELQAWLVARDAHSITQLFANIKYEGHPILWHFLLYIITSFTHNPFYMQLLHLLIACGFTYVFNRYSTLAIPYKILFSFGYLTLYEYSIIARCYGLLVFLLFIICALYKNRKQNYIYIGILIALISNIDIYGVLISLGFSGILVLDYFLYQKNNTPNIKKFLAGILIAVAGIIAAIYQILPNADNAFPIVYPSSLADYGRWGTCLSRLFTSYFYIPQTKGIHFWNSFYYFKDYPVLDTFGWDWLHANKEYLWSWVYMPVLLFATSIIIFLRKPLILLLYIGLTLALLAFYYYTYFVYVRYCGFLFIVLITCYWLANYYDDKKYKSKFLNTLSGIGKRIQTPFLIIVLSANVIGAMVAYSKDYKNKFSASKEAATYIKENKLDTLTIVGFTDYINTPLAAYLDTKLYFPEMNDYGSYCEWSKKRKGGLAFNMLFGSITKLMNSDNGKNKDKVLLGGETI